MFIIVQSEPSYKKFVQYSPSSELNEKNSFDDALHSLIEFFHRAFFDVL